jgi:pimeloyl-ACP methyl ester carboxylesterase
MNVQKENAIVPVGRRRIIEYGDYGAEEGTDALYFHGIAGSSREAGLADTIAKRAGIKLRAPNRYGVGRTTYQAHSKPKDWAEDIQRLADALKMQTFRIIGMSAGSQYALACARYIEAGRLEGVTIIGGPAPLHEPEMLEQLSPSDRSMIRLASKMPFLARIKLLTKVVREKIFPGSYLSSVSGNLPDCDRAIIARPDVNRVLQASITEAIQQGTRGIYHNMCALLQPWGFHLSDIPKAVKLRMFHGEKDRTVPPFMGRHNAARIEHAETEFFPEAGHFMAADPESICSTRLIEHLSSVGKKPI